MSWCQTSVSRNPRIVITSEARDLLSFRIGGKQIPRPWLVVTIFYWGLPFVNARVGTATGESEHQY